MEGFLTRALPKEGYSFGGDQMPSFTRVVPPTLCTILYEGTSCILPEKKSVCALVKTKPLKGKSTFPRPVVVPCRIFSFLATQSYPV